MSEIESRRRRARDRGRQSYTRRRDEVLRAAAEVFRQRGFGGTRLSEVAAALGMDRASLYYYVGSKDELFRDVVQDALAANARSAELVRDGPGNPPDKLRALLGDQLRSYADHYPFMNVYLQENLDNLAERNPGWAEEMRLLEERIRDAVAVVVQEGIDGGSVRGVAPAWVVARALLGMTASTARWFEPESSVLAVDILGQILADVVLDGLDAGRIPA